MYVPDKGDIVWLDFDPSAGKEIIEKAPLEISQQVTQLATAIIA